MTAVKANPFQSKNPFVAATYDGVIALALAMDKAGSIDPKTFVADIPKVTTPGAGVTEVTTYAALKAGKQVDYVGASGAMVFNPNGTANRSSRSSGWRS
jgi:hypothetical protein